MKTMKFIILFSQVLAADLYAQDIRDYAYLTLGGFNEAEGEHAGAEISVMGDLGSNAAIRLSGVLYSGINQSKIDDLFAGYSLTGYFHLEHETINPYLGLGVFGGKTFNCRDREEENDWCEEESVVALYPEFGIAFDINKLRVYPYVRRYFDSNSGASMVNAYGIQVGITFK